MSKWENGSTAVQRLHQRNLHQFFLWRMATSGVLALQVRKWMQIWRRVLLCTPPGWRTPSKKSKKNGDKLAVAILKNHEPYDRTGRHVVCDSSNARQLGCVFQDMEPPKSSSILRKSSKILKPIRCVQFTKGVLRHANIRDQKLSLGVFCPGDPHQRNPNAPKFEDRSQEETEWQEQGARKAAWRLAKSVLNLKGARKSNSLLTFGK